MDRRKAIAVAAAITMSLTSGVLAFGANFGAFGAGSHAARQNPVVAAAPANQPPTAKAAFTERERGDSAGSDQQRVNNATSTRGEQNG